MPVHRRWRASRALIAFLVVTSPVACDDPIVADRPAPTDEGIRHIDEEPAAAIARGILFNSDWSTARGRTAEALLDRSKNPPWDGIVGNGRGDRVVDATGLDFPTVNVYRSVAQYRPGGVLAENPRLMNGGMPTPAVGEMRYYRWYFRVVVPNSIDPTGGSPHPIQDAIAASDANWMFRFDVHQDGTWTPGYHFNFTPYPDNRYTLTRRLRKNVTYRFELALERTGLTTFQAQARIYDAAGNLLYSNRGFRNENGLGSRTLANEPPLVIGTPTVLDELQVGSNGPSWRNVPETAFPFPLWYTAAVAVCRDYWCGAYRGAETR